jgi:hypothetical protein
MSYTEQLLGSIDARMAEVNEEITSLSGALLVLRTDVQVEPEPAAAPPKRRARKASRRAAPAPAAATNGAAPAAPPLAAAPVPAAPAPVPAAPAPVPAAPAPVTKRAARRPRRTTRKLDAETLESMLQGSGDGLSAVAIAKAASAGYNQVLELLRELERAGTVIRTGTRRTSLWRLITDEERIAARAAELAAR